MAETGNAAAGQRQRSSSEHAGAAAAAAPLKAGPRAALVGTFMAEQTDSKPLKYTLVSAPMSSDLNGRAPPVVHVAGQGGVKRQDKYNVKCTVIAALNDIEPLLMKEEDAKADRKRVVASAKAPASARGPARSRTMTTKSSGIASMADGESISRSTRMATAASPPPLAAYDNDAANNNSNRSTVRPELFNRLSTAERPWVACQTDGQLLSYLAKRSGDRAIANAEKVRLSANSPQQSARMKHRHTHYRDLFDECLYERPASTTPAATAAMLCRAGGPFTDISSSLAKQGGNKIRLKGLATQKKKLPDCIKDIKITAEDPVEWFFDNEKQSAR
eukprot:TRINITY_DN22835_c0_g1_i1.p1 TRINITY_DN22835_c0_g1~~TRINITY_DN22835_c0_g1_i1.p1  ORF type:complete len:332 (-),score=61.06 TRINITY_DN22835_c0_g1_i1:193-1188(-)